MLREQRPYAKLLRKQEKEIDALHREQLKHRMQMQRAHCAHIDKLVAATGSGSSKSSKPSPKRRCGVAAPLPPLSSTLQLLYMSGSSLEPPG